MNIDKFLRIYMIFRLYLFKNKGPKSLKKHLKHIHITWYSDNSHFCSPPQPTRKVPAPIEFSEVHPTSTCQTGNPVTGMAT